MNNNGRDFFPGEAGESAEAEVPLALESLNRLRLLRCSLCGCPFATTMAALIDISRRGQPVHCPAGHASYLERPDDSSVLSLFDAQILVEVD